MKIANSAMEAGRIFEEEQKKEQRISSVQDAVLYTAAALQNLNDKIASMDKAQKAEHELNKKRDATNAKIAAITKWIAIATLAATIIGWFIK